MSDVPSFMDEEKAEAVEPVETPELPAEAEGEPTEAAPPAAPDPEPKHIPITALLDEREKRQRLERELEELRKARQELEAGKQQPKAPDFYDDPEARLQMERQQAMQLAWNNKLDVSEMLAREKHGDDTVEAAKSAFIDAVKRNPSLYAELQQQQNPYGYVVSWHKRQSVLSQMGDDPDAWIEQQIAARLQAAQAVQPKPTAPPPSVASAAPAGSGKAPPPSGFAQLFGE